MTSNYVYTPPAQNHVTLDYHNTPYLGPILAQTNSPFIPPMSLNPSPYSTPYISPAAVAVPLPPSPNPATATLAPNYPPFNPFAGDDASAYTPYVHPWNRERRSSWNGAPENHWSQPPRAPPVRQRTRSFNETPYPIYVTPPTAAPYAPYTFNAPPIEPAIHPYLVGGHHRTDLVFDLSRPQFYPARLIGHNQVWPLTMEDLNQTATQPPMYKLSISCDYWIPEWPLNLDFRSSNPYDINVPPIRLGDVLQAIHGTLNKRISQHDWAQLNPQQVYSVSQAYTRRCRAMGPGEIEERNQGVKRIDFLLGKTKFRGLVKVGDSIEHLKMIVD